MKYMNAIFAFDEIEDPKRSFAVRDPDFPDTMPNSRHWLAVQRPLANLQQVQLTTDVQPCRFGEPSDNVECVSVLVNLL